jgi:hypothetical protein
VDTETSVARGRTKVLTAGCREGDILTGGGHAIPEEFEDSDFRIITSSARIAVPTEWSVKISNESRSAMTFHARAICVHVEVPTTEPG